MDREFGSGTVVVDNGNYPPALRKYIERHMKKFMEEKRNIQPTTAFEPGQIVIVEDDENKAECKIVSGPTWAANRATGEAALTYDVTLHTEDPAINAANIELCFPEQLLRPREEDIQ